MQNKKAALEMSINTIVLLVLALALMGVIIGAFTGLFGQSEEKLLQSMLSIDATAKATSNDIIAGADAFTLQRNKDQIIAASFFNKGYGECEQSAQLLVDCTEVDDGWVYKSIEVGVPSGEEKTLPALIKIDKDTPKREYVCTLYVSCAGTLRVEDQHAVFKVI